jgi:hypothetical protein
LILSILYITCAKILAALLWKDWALPQARYGPHRPGRIRHRH